MIDVRPAGIRSSGNEQQESYIVRNFKKFIEGFLEYTKYIEAPETYLRWSAISIIAGALERKVWIDFKGQLDCYPNMYIILVGPPGLVKKSTSSKKAFELLSPLENLSFLATQFTDAALVKQLDKAGKRIIEIEGTEYPNSSVYIYASEAINTLKAQQGSGDNAIIRMLTDFYDCGMTRWSTEIGWSKETAGEGRINIFNPCVNLLACSVPDWLVQSIGKEDLKSGFASRCLFIVHEEVPSRQYDWDDKLPNMRHMETALTEDLMDISHLKGPFTVSQDFKEKWNVFDRAHKILLSENQDDQMYGYLARKPWHLLKLSQICKVSESSDMQLTGKNWEQAKIILEDIESTMYGAFGHAQETQNFQLLCEIWDTLRVDLRIWTRRNISLRFIRIEQKIVDDSLSRLVGLGKLNVIRTPASLTYQAADQSPLV